MRTAALVLIAAVALAAICCYASGRARPRLPRNRVRSMRYRLHLRLRPGLGFATLFELWLRWGRLSVLRKSGRTRPSLPLTTRMRHSREHSVYLGRAQYRHRLRMPLEEHVVIKSKPRMGKTALLADVILHYPGPVLSTTTKHDVFQLTSGVRSRTGPVHVFNPQGIGGVPSTFRWDPLAGCADPGVAIRRADAFAMAVSVDGTEDASFWSSKASSYLRGMLCAAALAGGDMRLVTQWALGSAQQAENYLTSHGATQWGLELGELRSEAQKTAATIRMVLSRALAFMNDPNLAASVLPGPGAGLDMIGFLAANGTLYMIADNTQEHSPLAPLFAAMAAELHWTALQAGQASPAGRLDPPLVMALDEVTQICPVPLPIWAADSGGKGIQIMSVVHGDGQLEARWKTHGKRVILDTAGAEVLLPGITDADALDRASKVCGQAAFREHGQEHLSRHDVVTPDMLRRLPDGFGLIIRGSCAPVVAKLQRAWKDRIYRKARRRGEAVAQITAAAPAALAGPAMPAQVPTVSEADVKLPTVDSSRSPNGSHAVNGNGQHAGGNGHGDPSARHPWGRPS